jgi:hypothetical protein
MWESRRLTTLWASTACYRDSFISSTWEGLVQVSKVTGWIIRVQFRADVRPELQQPQREANSSPAPSVGVTNAWSHTSTPSYVIVWRLMNRRNSAVSVQYNPYFTEQAHIKWHTAYFLFHSAQYTIELNCAVTQKMGRYVVFWLRCDQWCRADR